MARRPCRPRFDDAASEEFLPIAVYNGSREAAVFRMHEPFRRSFAARFERLTEIDLHLRERKLRLGHRPERMSHRTSSKRRFSENMLARP